MLSLRRQETILNTDISLQWVSPIVIRFELLIFRGVREKETGKNNLLINQIGVLYDLFICN